MPKHSAQEVQICMVLKVHSLHPFSRLAKSWPTSLSSLKGKTGWYRQLISEGFIFLFYIFIFIFLFLYPKSKRNVMGMPTVSNRHRESNFPLNNLRGEWKSKEKECFLAKWNISSWSHGEPRPVFPLPRKQPYYGPSTFHSPITTICTPTHSRSGGSTYPPDSMKWHHGLFGTQNVSTEWASPHVPISGTRPSTTTYTPSRPPCAHLQVKVSPYWR